MLVLRFDLKKCPFDAFVVPGLNVNKCVFDVDVFLGLNDKRASKCVVDAFRSTRACLTLGSFQG